MTIRILTGDALETLRGLPAGSVHCSVTSPPYWGLRDYGIAGQLGLEPTPEEHVARMVEVFREVRRVLRKDGTAWVNYGDGYVSGQGGRQSAIGKLPIAIRRDRPEPKERPDLDNAPAGWAERAVSPRTYPSRDSGLKPKDLIGMPWRIAFALQADGWWLRQDIIWSKPGPTPESVRDRCTKSHEYVFLLTKAPRYYFDADAVREESVDPDRIRNDQVGGLKSQEVRHSPGSFVSGSATRNRRSVWVINTHPFPEAHFATFPPALVEPCVKAGTSEKGCCERCGAPWERVVERTRTLDGQPTDQPQKRGANNHWNEDTDEPRPGNWRYGTDTKTTGWRPGCECGAAVVPCTVLDPFGGAGTTGLVADRLGRHAVLIELNPKYAAMAGRRIREDCPLFTEVKRS